MLAYLDALCAALLARNTIEIVRLLGLPEARRLPRSVRDEAITIARSGPDGTRAPMQALHLFYKLSHLVDESAELEETAPRPKAVAGPQMEFRFRVRKAG